MENTNQANKSIDSLFQVPENRENFQLLYKFLSQPSKGLSLCQALPEERFKILGFLDTDPLQQRIQLVDMVNPLRGPMELQQTIIDVDDNAANKPGPKKDIFFIYNIEGCIRLLNTKADDFFHAMNLIRDFFMQFNAAFVFFVTEASVKKMIREAFDFYDWMGFTFTFVPESKDLSLRPIAAGEDEEINYSNPLEKIEYLKNSLAKVKNEKARSIRLLELGKLYFQAGRYDDALERVTQSLEIEIKYGIPAEIAKRYNETGLIHKAKGDLDNALAFGLKAAAIFEKNNDTVSAAKHYHNIGLLYHAKGDPDKALEFVFKALEIFERNNDPVNKTLVNATLGKIYQSMGDDENASPYLTGAGAAEVDKSGWDRLLADIRQKKVIPVIGQGLYRVDIESEGKRGCLLYDYLAEQVAHACGFTVNPYENHKFAKACFEFLKRDHHHFRLSKFLREKLKGVKPAPGDSLWKLVRIRNFDIFMTTAYDDFLLNTINAVRPVPTEVIFYTSSEKRFHLLDTTLFTSVKNSQGTLIFQFFGNMIENIYPAYTEQDILETLLELGKDMERHTENYLFRELKRRSLLFIGCGYDDWLYRLFIRTLAGKPFDFFGDGYSLKYVADDFSNIKKDPFQELPRFLRNYNTEVFHTGSSEFVHLLFEKLQQEYSEEIINQ